MTGRGRPATRTSPTRTRFATSLHVAAPAGEVWGLLTDWPAHGRWVPMTKVTVLTEGPGGVGARFVGRTGLGPLAFDDVMEVTRWQPPTTARGGECEVVRQGRLLHGGASFEVVPLPAGGTRVDWREEVGVRPESLTHLASGVISVVGRLVFCRLLRAMRREAEAPLEGGEA